MIKIRTVVSWTEAGGAAGSAGDPLGHAIPLEVVRTLQEVL
jgi:uncharacterized protein with LGFP repeats